MGKIIGIDLGTSNSAASAMIGGKPSIIQAAEGTSIAGKAFPSVVAFTKDGQLLVGEPARRQMISNPEGTVLAAKRKMGTDFRFSVFGKEYSPQQISAFILQKDRCIRFRRGNTGCHYNGNGRRSFSSEKYCRRYTVRWD